MKKSMWLVYLTVLSLCFLFIQLNCARDESSKGEMSKDDMVARGKYLVSFGGCNDCHTPKSGFDENGPMLDTTKILSGHPAEQMITGIDTSMSGSQWIRAIPSLTAWVGPWGISYAANLTPDGPTGTGNWTEDIFMKAMRTGKHMGYGRPILPPMPWFAVKNLTDEDLKSVFAYLKSLKPVSNKVPDPVAPNMIAAVNKK